MDLYLLTSRVPPSPPPPPPLPQSPPWPRGLPLRATFALETRDVPPTELAGQRLPRPNGLMH
eukprot:2522473-Prymnesium_polylepis.1